jgi:dimeric dUTPase (all-alpha-NTP-PPase superfamily)
MNLTKLFETQKVLRDRIGYNEPDRFEKLILALLVEIGECANEYRAWKFWSQDQEPRTRILDKENSRIDKTVYKNPLLEEYVDGLHFLLEIGLEEFKAYEFLLPVNYSFNDYTPIKEENITKQFNSFFTEIGILNDSLFDRNYDENSVEDAYENAFRTFIGLGEMLGFTWEEIETAYYAKNQINHERQANGY